MKIGFSNIQGLIFLHKNTSNFCLTICLLFIIVNKPVQFFKITQTGYLPPPSWLPGSNLIKKLRTANSKILQFFREVESRK